MITKRFFTKKIKETGLRICNLASEMLYNCSVKKRFFGSLPTILLCKVQNLAGIVSMAVTFGINDK